ncbi:nuclear transport factor 2 family protein [Deinococcus sp. Arct2-2]|uniref:nuclear transport factor 2 family protein n=1 Tax=Deinococcus sp. Arct2-2 TaxID=2568653 RepID=UPI0010A2EC0C|nr:nuclear transport factor 2 family protein [Deinococcus sp. Arct2-2]THF68542.1 nuclear transport factor 2 family protein [Deinococcus sp. Arct2-2]
MTELNTNHLAEQLLFHALDALKHGDVQPWIEMFHDDGVMEFPYAPFGMPTRVEGKAAIAEYIRPYPERIAIRRIIPQATYHSGDVMVVEFAAESTALLTGLQVEMQYIAVITLESGKVKVYRDYWNPLVVIQAMGGSAALGQGELA